MKKITLKGYITQSPFKLMYLADENGVSDLAEAFPALILINILSEEFSETIKAWASAPYRKKRDNERNRYISRGWGSDPSLIEKYNQELAERADNVKTLESMISEIHLDIDNALQESKFLVVPITLDAGGNIRYLVNPKSLRAKSITKTMGNLRDAIQSRDWGGWYRSTEESCRRNLLRMQSEEWLLGAKLITNGEVKKHPCIMCPGATDSLEGACAFGGPTCKENLSPVITMTQEEV